MHICAVCTTEICRGWQGLPNMTLHKFTCHTPPHCFSWLTLWKSQLFAHHSCICVCPIPITHCPPRIIPTYLHMSSHCTFYLTTIINQLNSTIVTYTWRNDVYMWGYACLSYIPWSSGNKPIPLLHPQLANEYISSLQCITYKYIVGQAQV